MRFLVLLPALAILAGCSSGDDDVARDPVDHVWVRLPAVAGRPAAAYFDLNGGETDDVLLAIDSPRAGNIELHETIDSGGVMRMQPIMTVNVPAGETVAFAPGGRHAMLFDVESDVTPGTPLALNFRFDSGRDVQIDARTIGAGDEPPFDDTE